MQTAQVLTRELGSGVTRARASHRRRAGRVAKRAFDLCGSLLLVLMLAPALLLIAIGVRLSGRNVFFGHERVGRDGQKFRCLKFRSMHPHADMRLGELLQSDPVARAEWHATFKLKDDPRITRFGSWLRRTSLDELPQLFNVIAGDMCLVGPRPIVEDELVRYGQYARFYLSTRPGMTGLWQVSGRSDTSYRRRVALDCAYVRSQSLGLDLKILLKTVPAVAGKQSGAY